MNKEGVVTALYAQSWLSRHYTDVVKNKEAREAVIEFAQQIDRMLKGGDNEYEQKT